MVKINVAGRICVNNITIYSIQGEFTIGSPESVVYVATFS